MWGRKERAEYLYELVVIRGLRLPADKMAAELGIDLASLYQFLRWVKDNQKLTWTVGPLNNNGKSMVTVHHRGETYIEQRTDIRDSRDEMKARMNRVIHDGYRMARLSVQSMSADDPEYDYHLSQLAAFQLMKDAIESVA